MFRVRRAFAQTSGTSVNTLIAATIIVGVLYVGRSVLIPIAVAVLLAFILSPLVRLLRRLKLPSVVAVILVVGLCFVVLVAAGFLVASKSPCSPKTFPATNIHCARK